MKKEMKDRREQKSEVSNVPSILTPSAAMQPTPTIASTASTTTDNNNNSSTKSSTTNIDTKSTTTTNVEHGDLNATALRAANQLRQTVCFYGFSQQNLPVI
jgi:hypothetical protein